MNSKVLSFLCGQVLTPDDQHNESSHTGNKAVAISWGSMSKKGILVIDTPPIHRYSQSIPIFVSQSMNRKGYISGVATSFPEF